MYPMYQPYQDLQQMRDRIDQQMRSMQMPQQPSTINQTFQLAPQSNTNDLDARYGKDIEEVRNTLAIKDTLFIDKETSNLWIKKADGSIKTYTLTEVIELDEKDKQIINLQKQIEELKGMMLNAKSDVRNDDENVTVKKSTRVSTNKSNDANE